MSKKEQSAANVAATLGLQEIDTADAINDISLDILRTMYKYDEDVPSGKLSADDIARNQKIEKVYHDWTGSQWRPDREKVLSTLLLGSPGQGKTTAFKKASEKVATALGMVYLENPTDEVVVTKNHFLFVSQEFSAENSKMELGGLPAKQKGEDGVEYMTKLVNARLARLAFAGGGLLLLDDFPNASPNIQNVGLSLTDEKRFQGLNLYGTYIGLTGNLGSVDGTHTSRLSAALRGRCQIYFTQDRLENFVYRTQQKYRDELGDVGILGFMQKFEHFFSKMPNVRLSGGFESPRTWDHFIGEARRIVHDAGGRGVGEMKALPKLRRVASSILGLEVGQELNTYMHSMMQSADPLARLVIHEGKLDKEELQKKFKDGFAANQQHFAYQYSHALVDYTVQKIVKEGKLEEAISRFALGILPMDDSYFATALDSLKLKLAIQMENWSEVNGPNSRSLKVDIKAKIVETISKDKNFDKAKLEVMLDALTDADKYDSTSSFRKRRTAGK